MKIPWVLSLSLCVLACTTEAPVAAPSVSEAPAAKPVAAAPVAPVTEPEPEVNTLAAELRTVHVVAGPGMCTLMACAPSNPCCNRCQYRGWRLKGGDPDSYLKLRGIAVPAPEQDGCGVAFDLELTGRFDGDDFVVESFKKLPMRKR